MDKIDNAWQPSQPSYLTPQVKVVTLNARHSILLDISNSNLNEQVGVADGFGDDFWG